MPTNYDRWISNPLQLGSGIYHVVILRNRTDYFVNSPPGSTMYFNTGQKFLIGFTPIVKTLDIAEQQMKPPSTEITLMDSFSYKGTATDEFAVETTIEEETYSVGGLLAHIFDDLDAAYRVFIIRGNLETGECIFIGDVDAKEVVAEHGIIHKPQSNSERILGSVTISPACVSLALKSFTVQDFTDAIVEADMLTEARFFAGIVPKEINPQYQYETHGAIVDGETTLRVFALIDGAVDFDTLSGFAVDHKVLDSNPENFIRLASHGVHEELLPSLGTFPGTPTGWGIKLTTVFEKVMEIAGLLPFGAADFIPAFWPFENWHFYSGFDSQGYQYRSFEPDDICINYNYVFGISPYDGEPFSCPISFSPTAGLNEVLKAFALDWGCYIWTYIDSDTREIGVKIIRRDAANEVVLAAPLAAGIPVAWQGNSSVLQSREEPRENAIKSIVVKNKGSEGGVRVYTGNRSGEEKEFEVLLRARPFGSNKSEFTTPSGITFRYQDWTFNSKWEVSEQAAVTKRFDESKENFLSDAGWIVAAHYFQFYSGGIKAYPLSLTGADLLNAPTNEVADFFAFAGLRAYEGTAYSSTFTIDNNNLNSIFALAQFLAKENAGYPNIIVRTYPGVVHDTGKFNHIQPGLRDSWYYRGAIREFRAIETKQDAVKDETEIKWIEDYDVTVTDLKFEFFDGAQSTGGGTAGSATGESTKETTIVHDFEIPFEAETGAEQIAFWIRHIGDFDAIRGEVDNATSLANGVTGISNGSGSGVRGENTGDGNAGTFEANSGIGIIAFSTTAQSLVAYKVDNDNIAAHIFRQISDSTVPTSHILHAEAQDGNDAGNVIHADNYGDGNGVTAIQRKSTSTTPAIQGENLLGLGPAIFCNGSFEFTSVGISGNYNVTTFDFLVANATSVPIATTRNINLPTAASMANRWLWFSDESGQLGGAFGTLSIVPNGTESINSLGAATALVLNTPNAGAMLYSNGSNWFGFSW